MKMQRLRGENIFFIYGVRVRSRGRNSIGFGMRRRFFRFFLFCFLFPQAFPRIFLLKSIRGTRAGRCFRKEMQSVFSALLFRGVRGSAFCGTRLSAGSVIEYVEIYRAGRSTGQTAALPGRGTVCNPGHLPVQLLLELFVLCIEGKELADILRFRPAVH